MNLRDLIAHSLLALWLAAMLFVGLTIAYQISRVIAGAYF